MTAAVAISPLRSMLLIARGVWIELLRRKDLYVLLILMGLFALSVQAIMIVGISSDAVAAFLLNLGLTMASWSAHALALALMARQVPDEIEQRTLYPILAKPLERSWYLVGKWGASTLGGIIVFLVLGLMALVAVRGSLGLHLGMVLQAAVLQAVSLGVLTSLTLFLSVFVPKAMNMVLVGLLFFGGAKTIAMIQGRYVGSTLRPVVDWVASCAPNFGKLNAITRTTDGIAAIDAASFGLLVVYGLVYCVAFVGGAVLLFRFKPL